MRFRVAGRLRQVSERQLVLRDVSVVFLAIALLCSVLLHSHQHSAKSWRESHLLEGLEAIAVGLRRSLIVYSRVGMRE
jgi:branched-subunit amino acid transport protein